MAIVGFNFNKIDAQRSPQEGQDSKNIEVNHNLTVNKVEKTSVSLGGQQSEVLKVEFSFDVLYKKLGSVSLLAEVLYTDTKEIVEETYKTWENDQKLNAQVSQKLHSFVYNKSIVKAIELADAVNLPAPVRLPKVEMKGNSS